MSVCVGVLSAFIGVILLSVALFRSAQCTDYGWCGCSHLEVQMCTVDY
jgi:hypothetical protein